MARKSTTSATRKRPAARDSLRLRKRPAARVQTRTIAPEAVGCDVQCPPTTWTKLSSFPNAGSILCSKFADRDLGHHCLCTSDEGSNVVGDRGKFRWALARAGGDPSTSTYTISNAAFGGVLYVSDKSFVSSGLTMFGVYVRAIDDLDVDEHRHIWRFEKTDTSAYRIVSVFNNQALCESLSLIHI